MIKNALTAEEWKPGKHGQITWKRWTGSQVEKYKMGHMDITNDGYALNAKDQHAVAAICLHDQPFGFSWEDVEILRKIPFNEAGCERFVGYGGPYRRLADRIQALLPPKNEAE